MIQGSQGEYVLASGKKVRVRELLLGEVGNLLDNNKPQFKRLKETVNSAVSYLLADGKVESVDAEKMVEADLTSALLFIRMEFLGKDFKFQIECPSEYCKHGKMIEGHPKQFHEITLGQHMITPIPDEAKSGMFIMPISGDKRAIFRLARGCDIDELQKFRGLKDEARVWNRMQTLSEGVIISEEDKIDNIEDEDISANESANIFGSDSITLDGDKVYRIRPLSREEISAKDYLRFEAYYENMAGGVALDFDHRCPLCGNYCVTSITKVDHIPFFVPSIFFSEQV